MSNDPFEADASRTPPPPPATPVQASVQASAQVTNAPALDQGAAARTYRRPERGHEATPPAMPSDRKPATARDGVAGLVAQQAAQSRARQVPPNKAEAVDDTTGGASGGQGRKARSELTRGGPSVTASSANVRHPQEVSHDVSQEASQEECGHCSCLREDFASRIVRDVLDLADEVRLLGKEYNPDDLALLHAQIDHALDGDDQALKQVLEVEKRLVSLIKPAHPRSIIAERGGAGASGVGDGKAMLWLNIWLGLVALMLFIGLSTLDIINFKVLSQTFMDRDGWEQFFVSLFYTSAAALGATFYNLFVIYRHVSKGSFDPRYNNTYWLRFFLGIVAGFILAEVVTIQDEQQQFAKPLLAMLGGFSADAVEVVLTRLVETMKASVQGDKSDAIQNQYEAERVKNERASLQRDQTVRSGLDRALATLPDGGEAEKVKGHIETALRGLRGR